MFPFEKLRPWQKRFATLFKGWLDQVFMLVALPGGGKTIASLFAAQEWLSAGSIIGKGRYIVVVVPSRNLRTQWKKSAKKLFNLEMQTSEFTGALKPGMNGCVITYSALAADPETFRRLCVMHDVFVIFDEIHHLGESAAWGISAKDAFSSASRILAMSGTPWRSDTGQIPFLKLDDQTGEYKIHDRFDWPKALEEEPRAARYLAFKPYHGHADYQDKRTGENFKLNSRDTLNEEEEAKCLKGRLLEALFVTDILTEAHARLMHIRQSKPDAKGLVVCMDIMHAQFVAQRLKEVTGEDPVIAVSDPDRIEGHVAHSDPIENFKGSAAKWIVSVRQVSEGVDIPPLMVGVYLTNYVTELYFRQFVGRIARYQGTEFDEEAYVYMPHHGKLMQYADKIMELQAIALKRKKTPEKDEDEDLTGCGPRESSSIYLGGSHADGAGLVLPNVENADEATAKSIEEFAQKYGIGINKAALIMRDMRERGAGPEPAAPPMEHGFSEEPLEDRLKRERKKQSSRIGYLSNLTGIAHNVLNGEANAASGCNSVDSATEDQLRRRRAYIENRIQSAKNAA